MAGIEQKKPARLRDLTLALAVLAVGSCASTPPDPPRVQDNLCAIFAEQPDWRAATEAAALRWGTPIELQMAIIWRESGFRAEARPPQQYALGLIPTGRPSSAFGYAQAIDGTWDWYRRETGNGGADRAEFADATDFVAWYAFKSAEMNGIGPFDAFNHYLAYHEGHAGWRRGSYRGKAWLLQAATGVAERAARYRGQAHAC